MRGTRRSRVGVLVVVTVLLAAACNDDDSGDTTTTATPPTETTAAESTTTTTEAPPMAEEAAVEIPFLALWEESGHNDTEAEAFRHWDEEDPQVVPATCARCHSTPGYRDFLGVDGSEFGSVDADHPIGTTVQCVACHNEVTVEMTSVVMPSGVELTGLGDESRCMQCHQGRASMFSVDEAVAEAGVDDDTVSEDLGFINIHYFAAAATKYGTEAKGGYEYEGNSYDAFFTHVEGYSACIDCHDPHTLELKIDECSTCHAGVASAEDLRDVRMPGSAVDYDGDGDTSEGIFYEIQGVQGLLYEAMQRYALEFTGNGIVYDDASYPYFFIDGDGDGEVSEGEAAFPNQFASWTPRLLKAAYNYQVSKKDPGEHAHGGKYIIQLLVDSTEDLNSVLGDPLAIDAVRRIDHGHFAGSEEAFRHWDGEEDGGIVPGSCSRCHSAGGLPLFLTEGVSIGQPASNGFLCSTCHNDLAAFTRHEAASVVFPSGAEVDSGNPDANLCMTCHQGRASTATVNAATAGFGDNEVVEGARFTNVHYFPAGATLFGTEVQGGFEYEGQTYVGRFAHVEAYDTCTECHGAHTLEVQVEECAVCHDSEEPHEFRFDTTDFDGDGDAAEGLFGEVETLREAVLAAIQGYTEANGLPGITYDEHAYPYFFDDTGASYGSWTPALLKAAYNYQYATKDPGGFAHNGRYVIQLLIDSIAGVGGDTSAMTRP